MKRLTPFLMAALLGPAPAMAQSSATQVPLFGRTLFFQLPPGFVQQTAKNNGYNILIEYIPEGETFANWTQMVTIQAYRGLGRSRTTSAEIARSAFSAAECKIGPIYRDYGERVVERGLKRSIITNGCASLPAGAYPQALKGAGEQDFILMFRDAETVYTLNFAVRGRSFAGKAPPLPVADAAAVLERRLGPVTLILSGRTIPSAAHP